MGPVGDSSQESVHFSVFTETLIFTRHRTRHLGHTQELNLSLCGRTLQTSREAG